MDQSLRVLIVDDSSLYRRILSNAVQTISVSPVIETAPTGPIALKKVEPFRPDIVLLDIEMPEMSGIEVLKSIKRDNPRITVVLVSGVNSRSADITMEGLTSGASDFIPKPSGSSMEENTRQLQEDLKRVFELVGARIRKRQDSSAASSGGVARPQTPPPLRAIPAIVPARLEIIGIGISTGGPGALGVMVPQLSKNLPVPVVIVQHMPPVFTESLARSLDSHSQISVCEAKNGQVLESGKVYIAPGGIHTIVRGVTDREQRKLVIGFNDGAPVNSCKPAVDILFDSLARTTGRRTLAIVMTGMGHDGRDGAANIKAQQGYCISQSEETCTVYGMPQAVADAGISDEIIPLPEMANRINSIANGMKM